MPDRKRTPKVQASGRRRSRPRIDGARLLRWLPRAGWLVVMAMIGVLAYEGSRWLLAPQTLPFRQVMVEGELERLSRDALVQQAAASIDGGFFALDLAAVETALGASPWIRSVSLRRHWPDTLVVTVEEQVPVARWGDRALLNRYGELFVPAPAEMPEGLALLIGQPGREVDLMRRFLAVRTTLADAGLVPRVLGEDARHSWYVELLDGTRIHMGRQADDGRLDRLVRAWPQLSAYRAETVRRIDLRYTNGLALSWGDSAGQVPATIH